MKKNTNVSIIIKLICIVFLISAITTASFAMYKAKIQGDVSAKIAEVVAVVEAQGETSATLGKENSIAEYTFKVKNYKTENDVEKINQVPVKYYIHVTGLETLETQHIISSQLYYINEIDSTKNPLIKSTNEFYGYYNTNQILDATMKQETEYKLVIELADVSDEELNINCTIDLGYIQYIETDTIQPNVPELVDGMIPIIWDGNNWLTISENNTQWYNYDQQQWANVALISSNATTDYANVGQGTVVKMDDIIGMYVWVPRYVYKINPEFYHKTIPDDYVFSETDELVEIHFSKEGGDFWDDTIEVNNSSTADAANGQWTTHPAFTFGDVELNGIWVAKFQSSSVSPTDAKEPIYNKASMSTLAGVSMDTMFEYCRNIEKKSDYGLPSPAGTLQADGTFSGDTNGIDTHLMKNSEWSAITFLTNSYYGQGTKEVAMNPIYVTGGSELYADVFNTNVAMSTTGNATGIYDLSGNQWEYVSAYIGDGTDPKSKISKIYNALPRYKDIYYKAGVNYANQLEVYNMFENFKASIWETSGTGVNTYDTWFEGRSNIGSGSNFAITRGTEGSAEITTHSSIYAFGYGAGEANYTRSFRPVIVVGEGL